MDEQQTTMNKKVNQGKIFEVQWKKSVPNYALLYRIPDSAQAYNRNQGLRFSPKNPFDFILWDSQKHILYALEMKTVGGISISFERDKSERGEIHYHQIEGLNSWNKYNGIVAGFVIEFRQIEKTVFIEISEFNKLVETVNKKSFNINDLDKNNISYFVIPQKRAVTRYTYDIDYFLSNNNSE